MRWRIVSLVLAVSVLALAAGAARADEIVLRLPDPQSDPSGGASALLVGLVNEAELQGLQLRLDFDPKVAKPVSVAGVGRLSDPRRLHYWIESGTIRALVCDLSAAQVSFEPGEGAILKVTFRRSEHASSDTLLVSTSDALAVTASLTSHAIAPARLAIPMGRSADGSEAPKGGPDRVPGSAQSIAEGGDPTQFALRPEGPNPFSSGTRLALDVPRSGRVRVAVYDARGRLVRLLSDRFMEAGQHTVHWDGTAGDGSRAGAGLFFVRMTAEGIVLDRKVVALH